MCALCSLIEYKMPRKCMHAAGAACVHYLAGKKSINRSGKCHSGIARLEISKIYACCPCSMRR